jgi:ADP-ribose pyrophosphatase YjhB (NUDIX family)
MPPKYTIYLKHHQVKFLHKNDLHEYCHGDFTSAMIDWDLFNRFLNSDQSHFCCISEDPASSFRHFSTYFHPLEAAGGLVINAQNHYLFIFRHNVWDLPKGVIETGENAEQAATREVEEECGIGSLRIIQSLPSTYHAYPTSDTQWILKKTHWFLMRTKSDKAPEPQRSEGITLAEWRNPKEISDVRRNTYGSINELIDHCQGLLHTNQSPQE